MLMTHIIVTMTTTNKMSNEVPIPPKKRAIEKDDNGDTVGNEDDGNTDENDGDMFML